MRVQTKLVKAKSRNWERKANELATFGWVLIDATEYTRESSKTTYEGRIQGDKVYIEPHTQTSTKRWVEIKLERYPDLFQNLPAICPFEIIYSILNILLAIAKWAAIICAVMTALVVFDYGTDDEMVNVFFAFFLTAIVVFVLLWLLKKLNLRIAKRILKKK